MFSVVDYKFYLLIKIKLFRSSAATKCWHREVYLIARRVCIKTCTWVTIVSLYLLVLFWFHRYFGECEVVNLGWRLKTYTIISCMWVMREK